MTFKGGHIMNGFLFLTNQYLPKPGATGLCVHQAAKAVAARGFETTVICYANADLPSEADGVRIIGVPVPPYLTDSQSTKTLRLRSIGAKLVHLPSYPLRSSALVDAYVRAAEEVLTKYSRVVVAASYTPLEACAAAMKLKRRHPDRVRMVCYSADTLSNEQGGAGLLPASFRSERGFRWEKKLFTAADKVLIMECHEAHYRDERFSELREKMVTVNFPLLAPPASPVTHGQANEKTRFVYAGTLYRTLRDPSYMLRLLTEYASRVPCEILFLGGGDCGDLLREAETASNGAIRHLGMQPHSRASELIASADVLLSIGNAESPMAPSKIYEYMAAGKPIVHTYTYDKDPCIAPLQKYGNALLLRESDTADPGALAAFLRTAAYLPYETVRRKFETSVPDYTARKLIELI